MKKFTLAFASLALSVASMSAADYYLIGQFNNWTVADPSCIFTDQGSGVYELKFSGTLTSNFKINDGTWSNPDANIGSNGRNLVVGEPYYYYASGNSGNISIEGDVVENPTLILNVNEGTLTITGEAQEVEYAYAVYGSIFDGGTTDYVVKEMTEVGGKWEYTADVVPGGFILGKVIAGTTSITQYYHSPDGIVVTDSPMTVLAEDGWYDWISELNGSVTFSFDPEAMTLIVTSPSVWNDITADENATFDIYTIEGNLVKAAANIGDVENLENGMYIVNGQKLMICK